MKDLEKIKQNIKIEEYARVLGYHTKKQADTTRLKNMIA